MKYHIQVLISTILFALSFVWSKQALEYISPVALVTGRVIIAAILVTTITVILKKMQPLRGKDYLWFLVLAAAEPVGYFIFEKAGLVLVTPTMACLIIGLIPVITPFCAYLINRERVTPMSWVGLFIGFGGVVVVALSSGVDTLSGQMLGILLLFGSVITAIIYTLMVQRLSKRFNSFTIVSWVNIFSIPYLIAILLIFDFDSITNFSFSLNWFYPVLALGILCSSIAFVLYANGIRELGVTKTSVYINLMPGITAITSYFIIGEPLSAMKIAGIALTIIGLFVANIKFKPKMAN